MKFIFIVSSIFVMYDILFSLGYFEMDRILYMKMNQVSQMYLEGTLKVQWILLDSKTLLGRIQYISSQICLLNFHKILPDRGISSHCHSNDHEDKFLGQFVHEH